MARFDVSVSVELVVAVEASDGDAAVECVLDWQDLVKREYNYPDFEVLQFDGNVTAVERVPVSQPVVSAPITMVGGNNMVSGDSFIPAGEDA